MPEWLLQLLLAIISAGGLSGIGWWFKTRRDDRLAEKLGYLTQIRELQQELKSSQQEVKERDQDRIRYEMVRRESSDVTGKLLLEQTALLKDMAQTLAAIKAEKEPPP